MADILTYLTALTAKNEKPLARPTESAAEGFVANFEKGRLGRYKIVSGQIG